MQPASSSERGRWMSSDRPSLYPPWWRIPRLPRVVDLTRKEPASTSCASFGKSFEFTRHRSTLITSLAASLGPLRGAVSDYCPLLFLCTADFGSPLFAHSKKFESRGFWFTRLGDFRGLLCSSHAHQSHAWKWKPERGYATVGREGFLRVFSCQQNWIQQFSFCNLRLLSCSL